ncbi:MAG: D-alanine--D-alanine ligase family protein [Bdellovibrionota bacterium]
MPSDLARTVAVLFGGRSSEHEISLRSAVFILKNIPEKYRIIPVGIARDSSFHSLSGTFSRDDFQNITTQNLSEIIAGLVPKQFNDRNNLPSIFLPARLETLSSNCVQNNFFRVLNCEASCVFPVLHGPNGEDGRFQGLFELAEIAYVGCDMRSTVVGIDKDIQKRLALQAGISVAKYEVVELEELQENEDAVVKRIESSLGYPCFVKPNSMGSAVGTNKVKNQTDLKKALKEATAFDTKALVEELLVGTEVECAFLGTPTHPRITCAGEIAPKEFYSYEEKYADNSEASQYIPARLSDERMQELKKLAIQVAKTMGIVGFSRIDFWNIPQEEKFIFNEYNTIPGLTSISMFPKLWEHEGVNGEIWIAELVDAAYQRKLILDRVQFGIKAEI